MSFTSIIYSISFIFSFIVLHYVSYSRAILYLFLYYTIFSILYYKYFTDTIYNLIQWTIGMNQWTIGVTQWTIIGVTQWTIDILQWLIGILPTIFRRPLEAYCFVLVVSLLHLLLFRVLAPRRPAISEQRCSHWSRAAARLCCSCFWSGRGPMSTCSLEYLDIL